MKVEIEFEGRVPEVDAGPGQDARVGLEKGAADDPLLDGFFVDVTAEWVAGGIAILGVPPSSSQAREKSRG